MSSFERMKNSGKKARSRTVWQRLFAKTPNYTVTEIPFDENHPSLLRKREEAERLLANNKFQER